MSAGLLQVRGLRIGFGAGADCVVDGLDLDLAAGEAVALVGSSGAGKSLIARALVGLLPAGAEVFGGSICWGGQALVSAADFQRVRGRGIAYVFQDAASSLHPLRRIGAQMHECLAVHAPHLGAAARRQRIETALAEVGLDAGRRWLDAWPHQLSGGQRQRVMLALTLLPEPALLVADEPTSALDPVLARRVCDLLADAAQRRNMGLLLISHDLPRVAEYCERVYRLSGGRAQLQVEQPTPELTLASAAVVSFAVPAPDGVCIEARKLSLSHASGWRWPWQPAPVPTLDQVSLALVPGQRIGVVGSSGSGKSTLARGLLGLMPARAGEVRWFDRSLRALDGAGLRRWRSRVQLVFQDPFRSLDPMQRVDHMLDEALGYRDPPVPRSERAHAAHAALIDVGLDVAALTRY
ncbi:MAG TPA: ATP-binding cassette domain-containing protein, partial [Xanthomonadales bacterium]|nr:ATP-binding cassette domain-containing protein [Xanthomonadales bacterium]